MEALPAAGGLLAERVSAMVASEIRGLFAVAARPEVVSLAGGMPAPQALPTQLLSALIGKTLADHGTQALQYGPGQGEPWLREQICDVMGVEGVTADPDDVVVTVGSQQALDLVAKLIIDPGDVVLVESPAYVGALTTFASYQANVVHVPGDDDGMRPDALAAILAEQAAAGRRVKLLYTVPTFGNPSGSTLSGPRRDDVAELARRAGVLMVEDNPYGLLRLEGEHLAPIRARHPDVLYLGSFSKILSPGLRVGWALAPPALRDQLVRAAESALLCHSALSQLTVARYLSEEPWLDHVKAVRELYWDRRAAMLSAMAAELPDGCRFTAPHGGFFIWLGLPPGTDAKRMISRAIDAGVAYVPGTGFYADGSGRDHLRLSFSFPEPAEITEGVRRLADVIGREARGPVTHP